MGRISSEEEGKGRKSRFLKKNGVGEEYQVVGNFMQPWFKDEDDAKDDKKDDRRKKAAGGKAGGGAQGRETKTKSTKKKGKVPYCLRMNPELIYTALRNHCAIVH